MRECNRHTWQVIASEFGGTFHPEYQTLWCSRCGCVKEQVKEYGKRRWQDCEDSLMVPSHTLSEGEPTA